MRSPGTVFASIWFVTSCRWLPEWASALFSSDYLPHRYCYTLKPWLVWTNATSDALIFVAYALLFFGLFRLAYLVRHLLRKRVWLFLAFGTFILACGLTHLMEVITVWLPMYPLSALMKVLCVIASVPTAVAFLLYVRPIADEVGQYLEEIQTNRQALIASERVAAVGRMAASIAHEVNNPLESVMNLVHILKTDPALPATLLPTVQLTEREIGSIAEIANNTLRLYRESPTPVPVKPAEVMDSVLAVARGKLREHGIQAEQVVAEDAPQQMIAHPGELRQVLINLVENAVAAMPNGGKLRVTLRNVPRPWHGTQGLALRVADNGSGIPPELLPRLFDPAFTTKGDKGTGLGLWVVRQIVEKHGGLLTVQSIVGKGTAFSVWLPLDWQGDAVHYEGDELYPIELDLPLDFA